MKEKIIIVSAPSGAGKTTLVEKAIKKCSKIDRACTHTTRSPRPQAQEKDGIDYHFVSEEKFNILKENDEFLESAYIYGNWYATSKKAITAVNSKGKIPVLVIDVQGAANIMKLKIPNIISIFIRPPSYDELKRRLTSRGTEDKANLLRRMKNYDYEMSQMLMFDISIINIEIEKTVNKFLDIVKIV